MYILLNFKITILNLFKNGFSVFLSNTLILKSEYPLDTLFKIFHYNKIFIMISEKEHHIEKMDV